VSALLDMDLMCTDFDYETEKIESIFIGSRLVRGNLGPWPEIPCFGSFQTTVNILSQYDVTMLAREGSIPVQVRASKDVDLNPCHGDTVVVRLTLTLISAEPIAEFQQPQWLVGPRDMSFFSSTTLHELAIIRYGHGLLLHFTSHSGLQNTSVFWIQVTVGDPAMLRIEKEPGNSTGGIPLSIQPVIEVLDLGGTRITDNSVFVRATLTSDNISIIEPRRPCNASECSSSTLRRSTILGEINVSAPWRLSGNVSARVNIGLAVFTDLSVDWAAHGYHLSFDLAAHSHVNPVVSAPFSVFRGRPHELILQMQPTSWGIGGKPFSRQPSLLAVDAGGNPARFVDFTVTAEIGVKAAAVGSLHGQRTVAASILDQGFVVAIFSDLSIGKPAFANWARLLRTCTFLVWACQVRARIFIELNPSVLFCNPRLFAWHGCAMCAESLASSGN